YSTGGTPGTAGTPKLTQAQQAYVAFHGNPTYNEDGLGNNLATNDISGINGSYVSVVSSDIITFNEDWVYAAGVTITITLGGTPYTFTPTVESSAIQVAAGFAAVVYSGYTATATANVLKLVKTSPPP